MLRGLSLEARRGAITDNTWPPRDPNHDDDEDEEDEEQIEPIASMRVWIDSGKEDWRRPLPRPNIRTLPDAITYCGVLL